MMGDFNAKVGRGRSGNHIGPHGLGVRNTCGEKLCTFAGENDLVIMNTWKASKGGKDGTIIRNQIDYIMVNQRYRNSCKMAKTYPGADINSNHNLLVAEFRVQWKKLKVKQSTTTYDRRKLNESEARTQAMNLISDAFLDVRNSSEVEEKIEKIVKVTKTIKKEILIAYIDKRKPWMTEEIMTLMEERRKAKINNDMNIYRSINNQIRRKIREAKEQELKDKCKEIETAQSKHDTFGVYKKIKEITGKFKKKSIGKMENEQGEM